MQTLLLINALLYIKQFLNMHWSLHFSSFVIHKQVDDQAGIRLK